MEQDKEREARMASDTQEVFRTGRDPGTATSKGDRRVFSGAEFWRRDGEKSCEPVVCW